MRNSNGSTCISSHGSIIQINDSFEKKKQKISKKNNPYFIPGGGHGLLGTDAYVECYKEIKE